MKKILILLLMMPFAVNAIGQETTQNSNDIISVQPTKQGNEVCINIAGYDLIFGGSKAVKARKTKKYFNDHSSNVEFGFNFLNNVDYNGYDQHNNFMDLNNAKSIYLGITPFSIGIPFNRSNTLGLVTSVGLVWRNYVFADKLTLRPIDGMLRPVAIDSDSKKSKMNTFSIKIPLMIEFTNSGFHVAAGVYGDVILGSRTKYKFPKTKDIGISYINMFQAGPIVRIGYKGISIFGEYALTSIFKSVRGPQAHSTTIGVGVDF